MNTLTHRFFYDTIRKTIKEDVMIKSNIKELAAKQEITTPSDLAYAARVAWNTAKKMLRSDADISSAPLETLVKVATALDCSVIDLFEVS
jgi:DNA-binding Xre family transcriptional regulator